MTAAIPSIARPTNGSTSRGASRSMARVTPGPGSRTRVIPASPPRTAHRPSAVSNLTIRGDNSREGPPVASASRLHLRPRVLQRQRPVEDERIRPRVAVGGEVAEALELDGLADRGRRQGRLEHRAADDRLGARVDVCEEVAVRARV